MNPLILIPLLFVGSAAVKFGHVTLINQPVDEGAVTTSTYKYSVALDVIPEGGDGRNTRFRILNPHLSDRIELVLGQDVEDVETSSETTTYYSIILHLATGYTQIVGIIIPLLLIILFEVAVKIQRANQDLCAAVDESIDRQQYIPPRTVDLVY